MNGNNLLDKLKGVKRTINTYDNRGKELVNEIDINIPLEKLKEIVSPKDGDALLYMGYLLNPNQLDRLYEELGIKNKPNFELYYYVLECHGIYNW